MKTIKNIQSSARSFKHFECIFYQIFNAQIAQIINYHKQVPIKLHYYYTILTQKIQLIDNNIINLYLINE
jgi:hypothetical protein